MDYTKFSDQLGTSSNYARSNLFEVAVTGANAFGLDKMQFVCKSASLPAASIGVIEVPYQNRKLKVPGDRTFQDWTITIINDENMDVRRQLLRWQAQMQGFDGFGSDGKTPIGQQNSLTVTPLDRTMKGITKNEVTLKAWPSEIGSVDLSWETADTVQEYTVTFSVTQDNSFSK